MNEHQTTAEISTSGISRRRFFGYAGALAGAGLLGSVAGCKKDDDDNGISLGSGDLGLLNYLYALKQLQAGFYIRLFELPYTGITPAEQAYLTDIRLHAIAHRDLLKAFLGSDAVKELTLNFTSVDFHSRESVLSNARKLEDMMVSAINGAGRSFTQTAEGASYLTLIAKMGSVDARHAAIVRELLQPFSFADTSVLEPTNRIDLARSPGAALEIADDYFFEKLNGTNFPGL